MRGWTIWACPECGRYTTDSDRIECECATDHWEEIGVVPDADSTAVATLERNRYRAALEAESSMIGKTIAWVDESPSDPDYGGEDRGTILIHFTDGTALKIEGHSHDEVDVSLESLSVEDVRRRNAAIQGQREKARVARLQRQEWLSASCDERKHRRDAERAKASPMARLMNDELEGAMLDSFMASSRMLYRGSARTVRLRCPRCGERQCENAPTKEFPAA